MTDYKKLYEDAKEREYWREQDELTRGHDAYLEREANRREQERQQIRDEAYIAHSWKQAFRKNVRRLLGELRDAFTWKKEGQGSGYDHAREINFWRSEIRTNKLANDLLDEEMAFIAPIVEKLEARIETLKRRARRRVVKRVEEITGNAGSMECLIDGEPSDLLEW